MLATNFQQFDKIDMNISSESASISQSDKKIYMIEFDVQNTFLLNKKNMTLEKIKKIILNNNLKEDEYLVVVNPSDKTELQNTLDVISDLKSNKIKNISLGIKNKKVQSEN
tara:strand:- start:1090 stop:1422 length:333 start_codon:yes stop_codon:yes gene_type:complete